MISNIIYIINVLKTFLRKKYDTKNLRKAKTIIAWQISLDMGLKIIKFDQSAFVKDLVMEKELTEYNTNIILKKTSSILKIENFKDHKKVDL